MINIALKTIAMALEPDISRSFVLQVIAKLADFLGLPFINRYTIFVYTKWENREIFFLMDNQSST